MQNELNKMMSQLVGGEDITLPAPVSTTKDFDVFRLINKRIIGLLEQDSLTTQQASLLEVLLRYRSDTNG